MSFTVFENGGGWGCGLSDDTGQLPVHPLINFIKLAEKSLGSYINISL